MRASRQLSGAGYVDLLGGQQEFCCELVCLSLDFLDAPDLLSVNHEMSEFVCAVEAGAGTVVLVGAQDDHRMVGERQGEGVNVAAAERQTDDGDPVRLKEFDDVGRGAGGDAPLSPYLLAARSISAGSASSPLTGIIGTSVAGNQPAADARTATS